MNEQRTKETALKYIEKDRKNAETIADLLEALEAIVDLDARSSTRKGWERDIVKAVRIANEAIQKARES